MAIDEGLSTKRLEGSALSIDVAPVPDLHDHHDEHFVLDRVDDPIVSLTDSISIIPRKLLASWRAGVRAELLDSDSDAPTVFRWESFEFFGCRPLDEDLIACHDS